MSTAAANDTATERARISSAPGNNSDSVTSEAGSGGEARTRQVYFPGHGYAATRVVRRESLAPGDGADGPMIVESMDSTVVVPPEWSLRASENGILDVTRR